MRELQQDELDQVSGGFSLIGALMHLFDSTPEGSYATNTRTDVQDGTVSVRYRDLETDETIGFAAVSVDAGA